MTEKLIFAADHGILPNSGCDCSEAIQAMFDNIEYDRDTKLCVQFKTGEYRISKAIRINNARNLSIMGNRSRFVAHFDPTGPISANNDVFVLRRCEDISFFDIFFDTDNPIGATGVVTAINREENTVDVKINDEFTVTGFEHFCATNRFDEKGSPDYSIATYHNTPQEAPFVESDG